MGWCLIIVVGVVVLIQCVGLFVDGFVIQGVLVIQQYLWCVIVEQVDFVVVQVQVDVQVVGFGDWNVQIG